MGRRRGVRSPVTDAPTFRVGKLARAKTADQTGADLSDLIDRSYNYHSPPPSIKVHPNVVVSVATAFIKGGLTVDEITDGWAKQGATLGVREYYSVNTWDRDQPGHFYPTTLVADIDDDAPLVAEEQFGPALPIIRYRDLDEAIARANGVDVGLGASVWSSDRERARAVAARIDAGTVWINSHGAVHPMVPFGGARLHWA